jgi:cytochrome c oxidase subunit 4
MTTLSANDGQVHAHIAPVKFYITVFAGLIFLTGVTVGVSYFDFGAANVVVALVVATLKAGLVAAFFMHLTHDKLFNTLALISAFLFLGLFLLLTIDDQSHRGQVDDTNGTYILQTNAEYAPGGMPSHEDVGGGGPEDSLKAKEAPVH